MSNLRGLYGAQYDRYVDRYDDSTLSKMQLHYWQTKQTFLRKLRGKEDDCVVASDAELDAKLELLRSIDESCLNLLIVLESYQDRVCGLAHEESAAGRFLKECSKLDKTRAGKMMAASGKTLCYTAQQRIQLRNPLVRLYQEVETFQYRAVADTMLTVDKMEKSRTAYRAALLWMKDVSEKLDPDTYKQLEKFRKVQSHVRKTKVRFDKLKVDCLQKIDLLSASRCNMYSNALVGYQTASLNFFEKSSKTMSAVAEGFKGYQYYEFTTLKELTETSKRLAEDTANCEDIRKIFDDTEEEEDKDRLLFFESDYRDDNTNKNINKDNKKSKTFAKKAFNSKTKNSNLNTGAVEPNADNKSLLDLNFDQKSDISSAKHSTSLTKTNDILTSSDLPLDDMSLLNDLLNTPSTPVIEASAGIASNVVDSSGVDAFMPSQLIDLNSWTNTSVNSSVNKSEEMFKKMSLNAIKNKDTEKGNAMSSWFNLFADLDPLSNPDAIGKKADQMEDRNC